MTPLDFATGDDPVLCHLCGKDTSVAMIAYHLFAAHGIDPDEWADAEVVDLTEPGCVREPTDDDLYNGHGMEGGIAYTTDEPGSLGENDWRL